MGKNYYYHLGISRSATLADIKQAYRVVALKYHPDRVDDIESNNKFLLAAEAYDVLSDRKTKAVYDQFGEEGLNLGVPMTEDEGGFSGAYTFHGDARRVFYEFFGSDNPYAELFDFGISGPLRDQPEFGGLMGRARPKKNPDIYTDLMLTLEEVYRGCTKKMKIKRNTLNEDRRTSAIRHKVLTVQVPAGALEGTKFRFTEEGDQSVNSIPADMVFVVKDKVHPRFWKREGANLFYRQPIQLHEALCGLWVEIHTLDDRFITVPITDIVGPGYEKMVEGEGMPHYGNAEEKGNLYLSFDVRFPTNLSVNQKESLRHILVTKPPTK